MNKPNIIADIFISDFNVIRSFGLFYKLSQSDNFSCRKPL